VFEFIKEVHFAGMHNLFKILTMLFLVIWLIIIRYRKAAKAIKKLSSSRLRSIMIQRGSKFRFIMKAIFRLFGFVGLLIALLQPQWDKQQQEVAQEGRDILIAVDISRSMLCSDEKPNRLEFAKEKIKKILYNLKCERVGLIVFAGDAVVQCPLTVDYGAFFMFLDSLDVSTISSGTTSLDGALEAAIDIFKEMPEKKTKIVCLFTDGEDFSTNLSTVKEQASKIGMSIFTFGIGSKQGAPIPILNQAGKNIGFEKDSKGNVIMSKFNEGILKNLSEKTGGRYIKTTSTDADIKKFIADVEKFEKESFGAASFERYQEQYSYCIMLSFICFGLEWLL